MDPLGLDDDLGEIHLGYQPEELAKMFFEYVREHPTIHEQLRNFQLKERHCFMEAAERTSVGEHQLAWSEVHRRLIELLEGLIAGFVQKTACSDHEFVGAMEECKDVGSQWWTPFCSFLDISDYEAFSRMLQDNKCLCCGEKFVGYQPEEIVAAGEHKLEWSMCHGRFVGLIEGCIKEFVSACHCTEEEFTTAMATCMNDGSSPNWPPFAHMMKITDYSTFAGMLQTNTCLCCGEAFAGYQPDELAEKLTKYVRLRPTIHEQIREFQTRERHVFFDVDECVAAGQHRLEWSEAHNRFMAVIEEHLQHFMHTINCNDEELTAALRAASNGAFTSTPAVKLFGMILGVSDYVTFARMLQENVCLCCGEPFDPESFVDVTALG